MPELPTRFADYKDDGYTWITLATGEFYPDILEQACLLYAPVLQHFGMLVRSSESSERLFLQISAVKESWMRIQLLRVFKRYVSPAMPVEMTKKKTKARQIVDQYKSTFRAIQDVQRAFASRPIPDEPLCALLWEYKSRGQKGYDLTERFFDLFRSLFPALPITGPERAGRDILLGDIFPHYPNPKRPIDFVIHSEDNATVLAIGLARYDSDRGGAQEDDRTGGYHNCAQEIISYAEDHTIPTKVIFLNDGPGLLLGSMWNDYARLEDYGKGRVIVVTLRMVPVRITYDWLCSL
jgi:hypothetical protein